MEGHLGTTEVELGVGQNKYWQYLTKKFKIIHFGKLPSCIFSPFVHLLMFLDTILKLFRARSKPFFGIFSHHFLRIFQAPSRKAYA